MIQHSKSNYNGDGHQSEHADITSSKKRKKNDEKTTKSKTISPYYMVLDDDDSEESTHNTSNIEKKIKTSSVKKDIVLIFDFHGTLTHEKPQLNKLIKKYKQEYGFTRQGGYKSLFQKIIDGNKSNEIVKEIFPNYANIKSLINDLNRDHNTYKFHFGVASMMESPQLIEESLKLLFMPDNSPFGDNVSSNLSSEYLRAPSNLSNKGKMAWDIITNHLQIPLKWDSVVLIDNNIDNTNQFEGKGVFVEDTFRKGAPTHSVYNRVMEILQQRGGQRSKKRSKKQSKKQKTKQRSKKRSKKQSKKRSKKRSKSKLRQSKRKSKQHTKKRSKRRTKKHTKRHTKRRTKKRSKK